MFIGSIDFSRDFLDVLMFLRVGVFLRPIHGAGDQRKIISWNRRTLPREEKIRKESRNYSNIDHCVENIEIRRKYDRNWNGIPSFKAMLVFRRFSYHFGVCLFVRVSFPIDFVPKLFDTESCIGDTEIRGSNNSGYFRYFWEIVSE